MHVPMPHPTPCGVPRQVASWRAREGKQSRFKTVPVWIEQRTAETAHGPEERFALVVSDHEVREHPPYLGVRLTIGEPTFKRLDRASVEALVGREV